MNPVSSISSTSQFKESTFTFVWTIRKFNSAFNEDLTSPNFVGAGHKWYLRLSYNREKKLWNGLSLRLQRIRAGFGKKVIKLRGALSLINKYEKIVYKVVSDLVEIQVYGAHKFDCQIDGGFHNEFFRIKIDVWAIEGVLEESEASDRKRSRLDGDMELIKYLTSLNETLEFSDFEIAVNDTVFKVHKMILAARSNVFREMMKTVVVQRVNIQGFSVETVSKVIEFLYSGKIEEWPESENNVELFGLLKLSDIYDMSGLKKLCEIKLGEIINLENSPDIFLNASLCNASLLKKRALDFIVKHLSEINSQESFRTKVKEHHEHFFDIIFYKK